MLVTQMEQSEAGATGDGMESLGPGDGGHGIDYEFVETDKDSLGFVGVDRVKQLKRDVRKAWEDQGRGTLLCIQTVGRPEFSGRMGSLRS